MTDAAFLTKQYRRHVDLVGAFLRDEDRRMAVRAGQPFGVLTVRKHHIGHGGLHFTNDVQIHDEGLFRGIDAIPTRGELTLIQGLHPVDVIAEFGGRQTDVGLLGRLQDMRAVVFRIVISGFGRRRIWIFFLFEIAIKYIGGRHVRGHP